MSASVAAPASDGASPAASPSADPSKARGGLPGLVTRGLSKTSVRSNDAESPGKERSPRAPSTSAERPAAGRARSSSSVLSRLASRSSVQTSKDEPSSPSSSKMDRAALEKPRGKYKSGVNWSAPGVALDHEEPFMQSSYVGSPTDEQEKQLSAEEELRLADERAQASAGEMLSAGSTAAAKAHAQRASQAEPFFLAHQRALELNAQDQSLRDAATASIGLRSPAVPSPLGNSPGRSPARSPRAMGRPMQSTPGGVSHDVLVAEEGQRILAAARLQAAGGVYQPPMLGPEGTSPSSSPRMQSATSAIAEADERSLSPDSGGSLEVPGGGDAKSSRSPSPDPSTKSKRKTFLGFGGGSSKAEKAAEKADRAAEKKSGSSSKPSSRRASRVDLSMTSASGSASNVDFADTMSIDSSMGSIGPNGTARRRRYKDTRGLDILASELAAEALLSQSMPSASADAMMLPGSFTPEARRASMLSVLGQGTAMSTPSNASQASLPPLAAPQPPFANGYGSGSASSSRNNSPRLGASDLPRFQSTNSLSVPSSPYATQKPAVKGLPTDMLTGLGDGPYPSLPPRRLEDVGATDPFGLPMDLGSTPYDVSNTYVNRTAVYHTPVQVSAQARSRNVSATSTSTAPSSAKRAVLQMSMHNPETELQGLTKPPKSGKSTPFGTGSRAPSRTVTPKTSASKLRTPASPAGVTATPTQAEHAKQSARLREASEKLQASTQRRASPPAAHSSAAPLAPAPVPVAGVPAPVKASPAVVSASTPAMPPPAQPASKHLSPAAAILPPTSPQKAGRPAARPSRLSFFGGRKSQPASPAPPSPKPAVKGPTKTSIVASTHKPGGDIVPPVLNKISSRNTADSSAERGASPYSESGSSAAPHLSAPAPVAAMRRSSTTPDVRPAQAPAAAPPVPAVPAAAKQQSATLDHTSALRADLPGSKSSTTLNNSKATRASSESTKSVSKFSRFLSRLSGNKSGSNASSATPAGKKSPVSHVSSGASTPSNAAPSFATAQERTAPNSPEQARMSLVGASAKQERSTEDADLAVARAFLNPEMSASGFGTRAAYSSASAAPGAQQAAGAVALSERSRSASADRSGSLDDHSPQASEGSQEHASAGSASTRSATSAGTLATTPNASSGMVAASKEVAAPVEAANGPASTPPRAVAA